MVQTAPAVIPGVLGSVTDRVASSEGRAEALKAEGMGGACGRLRQGGPCCLSPLAEGAAPRAVWKTLVGWLGDIDRLRWPQEPACQCALCFPCRKWMPVWCVRSAPSTSMTSVQLWLDWVSGLECLFFVLLLRPPPGLPCCLCSPPPPPRLPWQQQTEAPERLCPTAWLPGSSCSENLSQQLPDSLPRCLHQYPAPAR